MGIKYTGCIGVLCAVMAFAGCGTAVQEDAKADARAIAGVAKKHSSPDRHVQGPWHIYDAYTVRFGNGALVVYIDSAGIAGKGYGEIDENDVLYVQSKTDEAYRDVGIDGSLDPQGSEERDNSKYATILRELKANPPRDF